MNALNELFPPYPLPVNAAGKIENPRQIELLREKSKYMECIIKYAWDGTQGCIGYRLCLGEEGSMYGAIDPCHRLVPAESVPGVFAKAIEDMIFNINYKLVNWYDEDWYKNGNFPKSAKMMHRLLKYQAALQPQPGQQIRMF